MKTILHALLLSASLASIIANAEPYLNNGPDNGTNPTVIYVARVPYGSGIPSVGSTDGYDKAEAVGAGLYQVPGYLPGDSDAFSISPRVIRTKCVLRSLWYCDGFAVKPSIGRGEYILIQPVFIK